MLHLEPLAVCETSTKRASDRGQPLKVHAPQHIARQALLGENSTLLEVSMVHHRRSFRVKTRLFSQQSLPTHEKIRPLWPITWLEQRAVLFSSGPHKVLGRFEPAGMSPNAAGRQISTALRVVFVIAGVRFCLRHV